MSETIRPTSAADEAGSLIGGRYRVDRLLAKGGMAVVYLADHVDLKRRVALKVVAPPADDADADDFERRFRLEAEILASLDHPNIVTLHDFGELDDGRFFLAMEYVDGPRFTDLIKGGSLPAERAVRLLLQVCAAVRYAHRRGVVHRDLKPSNLLIRVDEDGLERVKVVDFGLVKLINDDDNQSFTKMGLIMGSPHCMAPEQVKGNPVDERTDIYAIGVLLFRAITGAYPFHGPNSATTMVAHINQPVPTFFSIAPTLDLPVGLEDIVRKALAKDPADRFQHVEQLADALARCIDLPVDPFRSVTQTIPALHRVQTKAPPRPRTSLWGPLAAALAAALLSVIGTSLYFARRPAEPSEASAPAATPELAERALHKEVEPAPQPPPPTPRSATPTPTPAPKPRPGPVAPKPTPAPPPSGAKPPEAPAPTPEAAPAEAEAPAEEPAKPEGYMELPEDW